MELFSAQNIHKKFVSTKALTDVSISVPEGSIFGLLGPNGAGKTTLIRIINQITAPDKGKLFFEGKKLSISDIAKIGYLPEERGLYKKMKIGEQATYLVQLKGLDKKQAVKNLKFWFKKFEIITWWDKKIEELSKGMQQKVQFITTIAHKPKLIIFDEPFSGFDPINANLIKQEILELRDQGATIIFSTHNMGSVEELCDHIALINKSKKILDGETSEIRKQFKSNIYEIEYSGELPEKIFNENKIQILSQKKHDEFSSLRIQHMNGNSNNSLLNFLIPFIEIISFKEVIPSMNDVFIKVVESANKN